MSQLEDIRDNINYWRWYITYGDNVKLKKIAKSIVKLLGQLQQEIEQRSKSNGKQE